MIDCTFSRVNTGRRPARHGGRALALAMTLTLMGAGASAAVLPGARFGTTVDAGGMKTGGSFQNSASANYSNENVLAQASAATQGFSLHASAWTSEDPTLPAYCTVYTCTWQTYATVSVWDTIVLYAPADGSEGTQPLNFAFVTDGIKHRGKWAYGDGAYASASYYFGTSATGWEHPNTVQLGSSDEVKGTFEAPVGFSITVYLYASLSVSARSGSFADYSNTMKFLLDVPDGWTYTSASGLFSPAGRVTPVATPVPEPGGLVLTLAGLGCIWVGSWAQARFSRRASS